MGGVKNTRNPDQPIRSIKNSNRRVCLKAFLYVFKCSPRDQLVAHADPVCNSHIACVLHAMMQLFLFSFQNVC